MKGTSRVRKLELIFAAALGIVAILALPALASAKARDRNHDGIPDRWEKRHHLSLHVNQAHRDQDRDRLNNLGEFQNGTNPRDADTDNDGLSDGQETEAGDDPTDNDTDGDGVPDGQENAGTIASFDGTTLTINLFDGNTMTGQVNDSTEIECDHSQGDAQASDEHGSSGDEGSGDSQGSDEGDQQAANCGTADLIPGAPVHEAELEATSSGEIFHSVHLAG
jgi:Bacterial TSP3 repeat